MGRRVIYPMQGLLRCSSQRNNNKNITYTTYNPKSKGLGLKVFFLYYYQMKEPYHKNINSTKLDKKNYPLWIFFIISSELNFANGYNH